MSRAEEVFKDIKGYEGYYKCSNYGTIIKVKRSSRSKEKIIKLSETRDGYYFVILHKSGNPTPHRVHRLVMQTFAGESDLTVNHIDNNRKNNYIGNLEYMTRSENTSLANSIPFRLINNVTGEEKFYNNTLEAYEEFGFKYQAGFARALGMNKRTDGKFAIGNRFKKYTVIFENEERQAVYLSNLKGVD